MADDQKNPNNNNSSSSSSSSSKEKKKVSTSGGEMSGSKGGGGSTSTSSFSGGQKAPHYPNQREASIPDAATLRDQWKYAIRQYSKWNSNAWGAVIFAGVSFYALGWIIKGSNPLPSRKQPPLDQADDTHK